MTDPTALTWDELDELADWSAGELTGPAAERIATLVRTDRRWAAAQAALAAAETHVQSALRAASQTTGAGPQRMPDDVVARVDAALAAVAAPGQTYQSASHPAPAVRAFPTQPTHPRPTGPGPARPPARPTAARRSRRPLFAGLTVLLLFVGGVWGVTLVGDGFLSSAERANAPEVVTGNTDGGASAPVGPDTPTPAENYPQRTIASGTDYQRDTLAQLATEQREGPALSPDDYSDELRYLATADGLDGCVAALLSLQPGTVVLADFATFEGHPAVILVVRAGTSVTVFAVGPECGPGNPDLLTSPVAAS